MMGILIRPFWLESGSTKFFDHFLRFLSDIFLSDVIVEERFRRERFLRMWKIYQSKKPKQVWKNTLTWCFPDCRLFFLLTAWPPGVWKLAHVSKLKNLGRIIWSNSAKTLLVRRVLIQTRSLGTFFALTIRSASPTQVPQNDSWGVWDQQINRFQSWRPYFCQPMRIWEKQYHVCLYILLGKVRTLLEYRLMHFWKQKAKSGTGGIFFTLLWLLEHLWWDLWYIREMDQPPTTFDAFWVATHAASPVAIWQGLDLQHCAAPRLVGLWHFLD